MEKQLQTCQHCSKILYNCVQFDNSSHFTCRRTWLQLRSFGNYYTACTMSKVELLQKEECILKCQFSCKMYHYAYTSHNSQLTTVLNISMKFYYQFYCNVTLTQRSFFRLVCLLIFDTVTNAHILLRKMIIYVTDTTVFLHCVP